MLKRAFFVAVAVSGTAALATASDLTPQQAMEKMMNCMACQPMNEYPEIGPNIRYDIHDTKTGFISSFLMANEKMMPSFVECEKKCDVARAEAMKFSDEEAKEKLCPFCLGMRKLIAREDVTVEEFEVAMGRLMIASADTKDGIAALHDYSMMARETSALLAKAAMEMEKPKGTEEKKK